jgi:hypothetical protein
MPLAPVTATARAGLSGEAHLSLLRSPASRSLARTEKSVGLAKLTVLHISTANRRAQRHTAPPSVTPDLDLRGRSMPLTEGNLCDSSGTAAADECRRVSLRLALLFDLSMGGWVIFRAFSQNKCDNQWQENLITCQVTAACALNTGTHRPLENTTRLPLARHPRCNQRHASVHFDRRAAPIHWCQEHLHRQPIRRLLRR